MSYKEITKTRYLCHCEVKNRKGIPCLHSWEADKIPVCCPKCQSRLWNGPVESSKLYTLNGRSLTISGWAKVLGVKRMTLYQRIRRGYPIEDVLTPGKFVVGRKPKDES